MRPRAALVILSRLDEVRWMLAADLRDAVDLRIRGAPAGDAVAPLAHRDFLAAELRIALRRCCWGRHRLRRCRLRRYRLSEYAWREGDPPRGPCGQRDQPGHRSRNCTFSLT